MPDLLSKPAHDAENGHVLFEQLLCRFHLRLQNLGFRFSYLDLARQREMS